jgi:hypothetical protein
MSEVRSIVATLHQADLKLVAAVKAGDTSAVGPVLAAIGKNGCGPCHTKFSLPESAMQR